LSDQNILLRAQLSATSTSSLDLTSINTNGHADVAVQKTDHEATKLAFYEAENSRLLRELEAVKGELARTTKDSLGEVEKMKKDNEDLLELLADQVCTGILDFRGILIILWFLSSRTRN
jgi:hypothetical protein